MNYRIYHSRPKPQKKQLQNEAALRNYWANQGKSGANPHHMEPQTQASKGNNQNKQQPPKQ